MPQCADTNLPSRGPPCSFPGEMRHELTLPPTLSRMAAPDAAARRRKLAGRQRPGRRSLRDQGQSADPRRRHAAGRPHRLPAPDLLPRRAPAARGAQLLRGVFRTGRARAAPAGAARRKPGPLRGALHRRGEEDLGGLERGAAAHGHAGRADRAPGRPWRFAHLLEPCRRAPGRRGGEGRRRHRRRDGGRDNRRSPNPARRRPSAPRPRLAPTSVRSGRTRRGARARRRRCRAAPRRDGTRSRRRPPGRAASPCAARAPCPRAPSRHGACR